MKIAIRYYSKSGNTRKIMEAISKGIQVECLDVSIPLDEKVDVLFLGSAVYAAGIDKRVSNFIRANKDKIGMIVNVSTAAALSSTFNQVSKVADECNVKMCDQEFHCRGKFGPLHKNRPNQTDCQEAVGFAKKIIQ